MSAGRLWFVPGVDGGERSRGEATPSAPRRRQSPQTTRSPGNPPMEFQLR
jgi:hypothetical protein